MTRLEFEVDGLKDDLQQREEEVCNFTILYFTNNEMRIVVIVGYQAICISCVG